jgi:hypothetical protein
MRSWRITSSPKYSAEVSWRQARRGPLSKSFGFVLLSAVVTVLTGVQPEFLEVAFEAVVAG